MPRDVNLSLVPNIRRQRFFGIGILLFILILVAVIICFWQELKFLERYSYAGAFIICLLGNSTIIFPVPALAFAFALGGVVKYPLLLGLAVGLGSAIGELSAYIAGRAGRNAFLLNPPPRFHYLEDWMRRRGGLLILVFSALPAVPFDILGLGAGALGYPMWRFFLLCLIGKMIKGMIVVLAGALGLKFLLEWLGIIGF